MPTSDDSAPHPTPDEAQYEVRVERVVRGRETRTKTKMQNEGWEFVSQSQGRSLRRELTFRRAKRPPMTHGRKKLILAGIGALVVLVIIGGVAAALLGGNDASEMVALDTESSATPSETASPEPTPTPSPTPTATPTPSPAPTPAPTETPLPYTYVGPEYEVVAFDPKVGLGKIDQYWVLTDKFDYSSDAYKRDIGLLLIDLARQEGTPNLIVNVVSDAEIIEAESAATMAQFANKKGPDYFADVIAPKEESDWAASYTGGINYNTGKLSDADAAYEIIWRPYATSEVYKFKPIIE